MFESLVVEFAGLAGAVWAFVEFVPRVLPGVKVNRERLALVLGPVAGVVGHWVGVLSVETPGARGWVLAALVGVAGTVSAGLLNDYITRPVQKIGGRS